MHRNKLFLLALIIIVMTAYLTLAINAPLSKHIPKSEVETAINQARHLYQNRIDSGEDLSKGPCLSDALMPGWVLDIAHNPRIAIDDLSENQCPSFREGKSVHFVELDSKGNLIRAQ